MEPLFFKAENLVERKGRRGKLRASMEPLFFKAENRSLRTMCKAGYARASMEPLFFKAENGQPKGKVNVCFKSFNGAAFFQSGKSYRRALWSISKSLSLQWSRFFSKRKMQARFLQALPGIEGFNGAAFFQSGKFQAEAEAGAAKGGFNGAAFFQSGK